MRFPAAVIAFVIITNLPAVALAQTPPPPDAGTGPYDLVAQPGTGVYTPPGLVAALRYLHELGILVDQLSDPETSAPLIPAQIERVLKLSDQGFKSDPALYGLGALRAAFTDFLWRGRFPSETRAFAARVAMSTKNLLTRSTARFQRGLQEPSQFEFGSVRVGSYSRGSVAYGFQSLLYSPLQYGSSTKFAPFVTGSALLPLTLPGMPATASVGAGFSYGDPYRWIATGSVGSFLSPAAVDCSVAFSYKLAGIREPMEQGPVTLTDEYGSFEVEQPLHLLDSSLLDHIRPGDVWVDASVRNLSRSRSSRIVDGNMLEASLLVATRTARSGENPKLTTTFSLTGIYSPRRELGVNEMGVGAQMPIAGRGKGVEPIYLGARYGTRGTLTFSLGTHF